MSVIKELDQEIRMVREPTNTTHDVRNERKRQPCALVALVSPLMSSLPLCHSLFSSACKNGEKSGEENREIPLRSFGEYPNIDGSSAKIFIALFTQQQL